MEDIVAVAVTTDEGRVCYFLTWGRIQNSVDPEPLEQLIMDVAAHFKMPGNPVNARVCSSLQDARDAPYFFEYFFRFSQKRIPFGRKYASWRKRMDKRMRAAHEIAAVGPFV